jgi:hypothetical protein
MKRRLTMFLAMTQALSILSADNAIGIATVRGSFKVDGSSTSRQATLFGGTRISTDAAASEMRLNSGTKFVLAPGSEGVVFADHVVLRRGGGQLDATSHFRLQTEAFDIAPAGQSAMAQFTLASTGVMHVSSIRGSLALRTPGGALLANLAEGKSAQLSPKSGAGSEYSLTGKVYEKDGHFFVTDEASRGTFEVSGSNPERFVGKRVRIEGSSANPGAPTPVVEVRSISAFGGGLSTVAVVSGVVVASAAAAGLGVALTRDDKPATISR